MSGLAPEHDKHEEEGVTEDVRDMIQDEAGVMFSKHARVLVYINTGALLVGAVWLGIYIQRFVQIEQRQIEIDARISRVSNIERLDAQISALTAEVNRLRDRLERLLDEGVATNGLRRREREALKP